MFDIIIADWLRLHDVDFISVWERENISQTPFRIEQKNVSVYADTETLFFSLDWLNR